MKVGQKLSDLAAEIARRATAKKDFVASVEKMSVVVAEEGENGDHKVFDRPHLKLAKQEALPINRVAHNQLIEFTKIPGAYYNLLLEEDPELLVANVNKRMRRQPDKRRMIRTLDGRVRAVLSDSYRVLENEDFADAVLPVIADLNLIILSAEITDTRLYIKAVDQNITANVPRGAAMGDGGHTIFDTVSPAITVSNSEVGCGAVQVEGGIYTRACTNLALFGASMRKYHTGKRAELSDEVYAMLTDETKKATDRAVWLQARDMVKAVFSEVKFKELTDKLTAASEVKIEGDVVEVVKNVAKRFTLNEGERSGVLTHLISGGSLTQYGLHAAVTRMSADVADYDRATHLEQLGGDIIDLGKSAWEDLQAA